MRRIAEAAVAVDRERREVVTATTRVPYDFLVLAPGVEYDEDAIRGYGETRERLPVVSRPFEQHTVEALVDRFLDEGGIFLITVPEPPYRCPPALYERACIIAERTARRIAGRPEPAPGPAELPAGICFAAVTHDQTIMITVDSTFVPGEGAKARFQVDAAPSRESSEAAASWGREMWKAMLD